MSFNLTYRFEQLMFELMALEQRTYDRVCRTRRWGHAHSSRS